MKNITLAHKTILVTGAAGFIGAALTERLLSLDIPMRLIGIDDLNDYYDPALKDHRLRQLQKSAEASPKCGWTFIKGSVADKALIDRVFRDYAPDIVVNLAAQAGVRYSIDHPDVYIQSNIIGFYNILEACRHSYDGGEKGVEHLVYASSSSVYGGSKKVPFSTDDKVDNPVSLYAATKKSNELLAHSYAKLYNIPVTGLRLFSVYGPAGRPDMFYYAAAAQMTAGGTVRIYNHGRSRRDFTFIDDAVESILRVMRGAPKKRLGADGLPVSPYAVYDVGRGKPESVLDFISTLQEELVRAGALPPDYDFDAHRELVGMQPGDVAVTYADADALEADYGFRPKTGIRQGLREFAQWYVRYIRQT